MQQIHFFFSFCRCPMVFNDFPLHFHYFHGNSTMFSILFIIGSCRALNFAENQKYLGKINLFKVGAKIPHSAVQCGTYRPPLPNLFTYIAQPEVYDLRQSTSTQLSQLIPSCLADPPRRRSDQPCPFLPLLYRYCKLLQADARWQ